MNSKVNFVRIRKRTEKLRRTIRLAAPNRLLSIDNLNRLLKPELKKCGLCGDANRKLSEKNLNGIATCIVITCGGCDDLEKKSLEKVKNLNRTLDKLTRGKDSETIRKKKNNCVTYIKRC